MSTLFRLILGILVVLLVTHIGESRISTRNNNREKLFNSIKGSINSEVDPCDDFYEYVCGNYGNYTAEAEDGTYSGVLYSLQKKVLSQIQHLLNRKVRNKRNMYKAELAAINFYKSCLNTKQIERKGTLPIKNAIKNLGEIPGSDGRWSEKKFNWIELAAKLKLLGTNIFLQESVVPFEQDSNNYIIQISHTSLDVNKMLAEELLISHEKKLLKILVTLLKFDISILKMYEIIEFQSKLFDILPSVSPLLPLKPVTISEIKRNYSEIDWELYLSIVTQNEVNLEDKIYFLNYDNYFEKLIQLIEDTDKETIATYMIYKFIDDVYIYSTDEDRSDECVELTTDYLDSGTSSLFIKRHFVYKSRDIVSNIMNEFIETFKENLNNTRFLDDNTKQKVIDKVNKLKIVVGYQDFMTDEEHLNKDYEDLVISPNHYYENVFNIQRHNVKLEHSVLKNQTKRFTKFPHSQVNAFYDILHNTVFIPPGILQPPVFHIDYPKTWLYATIGAFAGHELIHAFDVDGKNYNADGVQENWWSKDSELQYLKDSECFVNQYDNYDVLPHSFLTMQLNGTNTLAENIADNGALRQMYQTYKKWSNKNKYSNNIDKELIPDLDVNAEKLFFISFGNIWCESAHPLLTALSSKLDTHAPVHIRINGAVSNLKEFSETFQCPESSPMNPKSKCILWRK